MWRNQNLMTTYHHQLFSPLIIFHWYIHIPLHISQSHTSHHITLTHRFPLFAEKGNQSPPLFFSQPSSVHAFIHSPHHPVCFPRKLKSSNFPGNSPPRHQWFPRKTPIGFLIMAWSTIFPSPMAPSPSPLPHSAGLLSPWMAPPMLGTRIISSNFPPFFFSHALWSCPLFFTDS